MNCRDAVWKGRRNILAFARPSKALPDVGFFRNTGVVLVILTVITGSIAVGMTLIQF